MGLIFYIIFEIQFKDFECINFQNILFLGYYLQN